MATRARDYQHALGQDVPTDDVMGGATERTGIRSAAAKAAIEIAGRAAWLAWQIDVEDVNAREARQQLSGIADDLARWEGRFPSDLSGQVSDAFKTAYAAAVDDDLRSLAQATQQIRVILERYHNASLA